MNKRWLTLEVLGCMQLPFETRASRELAK